MNLLKMKLVLSLALLLISVNCQTPRQGEKISLKKDVVYALSTKVKNYAEVDRQIATLEFFGAKVDCIVDFRDPQFILPGEGFKSTFKCDDKTKCATIGPKGTAIKYGKYFGTGQAAKLPLKLVDNLPDKYDPKVSGVDFYIVDIAKTEDWPVELGVFGLSAPSIALQKFTSEYKNEQNGFGYEYYAKVSGLDKQEITIKSFKLHLSQADSEKVYSAPAKAIDRLDVVTTFEDLTGAKEAVFDNKATYFAAWAGWETTRKALNQKLCGDDDCVKVDESKYSQLPNFEIKIAGKDESKIVIEPKTYVSKDKDNKVIYHFATAPLTETAPLVLGAPLFSETTGASIVYLLQDSAGAVAEIGFGFEHGKGKIEGGSGGLKWWGWILIILAVLLVIGLIAGGVFFFMSKKKDDPYNADSGI